MEGGKGEGIKTQVAYTKTRVGAPASRRAPSRFRSSDLVSEAMPAQAVKGFLYKQLSFLFRAE